jgi:hypothetical protein
MQPHATAARADATEAAAAPTADVIPPQRGASGDSGRTATAVAVGLQEASTGRRRRGNGKVTASAPTEE